MLQGREQVIYLNTERLCRPYYRQALFGSVERQLSPNATWTEQVHNQLTDVYNNGQQDYTLLANKDVATEPLQMILGGLSSLEIPTNMLESRSLSLVGWRQPNIPDAGDKTASATGWRQSEDPTGDKTSSVSGWRQSDEQLHTSNIEQRHVLVQAHIVRLMHTVEQTLASAYLTRLTEIEESSTGGRNTQEIDIEDSVS